MKWSAFLIVLISFKVCGQGIETVIQRGHELAVLAIQQSPDSNYVATGSRDKSAKLWDISSGREVRSFLGHEASVTCLAFTPDGRKLLTGSNDRTLRLWDVGTGKALFVIQTPDYIRSVAIDPRQRYFIYAGYAESSSGDSATVYDFQSRKEVKRISVSPDMGNGTGIDLAWSADGQWLAVGEDNRETKLYATANWKMVKAFAFESGFCGGCGTQVAFSPDSKFLFTGANNGPVRKYDLATFSLVREFEKHADDLNAIAVSPDGTMLARATDKGIRIFNMADGRTLDTLAADEKGDFHEVAFGVQKGKLLVTSDDNTAFVYQVNGKKKIQVFTGFLNQRDKGGITYDPNYYWQSAIARFVRFKNSILITPDGKSLIKGRFGTRVKRWDIASGKPMMDYSGHQKAVLCQDLSKDGRHLVTGGGDGRIILWDTATGDSLLTIRAFREPIFDIRFNGDETQVVSASWDATMKIHSLTDGKTLHYFDFQNTSAYNVLFHPNGLYVYTARLDNSLQMWELDTKREVRNFIGHTDNIGSIRLSPDQRTLLSAGWDGTVRLWDVGTGLMNRKFSGHAGAVHIAIFGDGNTIYSAGADRIIRQWDVTNGKVARTFEGHNAEITSLVVSPDNRMLVSHSLDGVTKFWDLANGKEFFEHIHLGDRDWMARTPNGFFNATDGARQFIHFVDGLKTYGADQFFNEYYRPELLPELFQDRTERSGQKGIQGRLRNSPPPLVKLAVVPAAGNRAEIFVKITDQGGGAQGLRLLHNGKSLALEHSQLKYPQKQGSAETYKQVVDLISGNNTFTAIAGNRDRIESDASVAELTSDHVARNSTCHILCVGINRYKNAKLNLNYARPDAESFKAAISSESGTLFRNVEVRTLYDDEATRANILSALDDLAGKINQEDVFIFYYAGHGSMVENKFYFIPTETLRLYDEGSLNKEALEATLLQEKFSKIKALKQLIIMDACQSGGSVELLAARGASEEKAIAQLSRSAGIHVLASAGSEQFAAEFAELGHGLFTYALMKALEGEADGAPKDGKVTIYELKGYLDDQVPELTRKMKGRPQYPYTFSRGQDFPIVIR